MGELGTGNMEHGYMGTPWYGYMGTLGRYMGYRVHAWVQGNRVPAGYMPGNPHLNRLMGT